MEGGFAWSGSIHAADLPPAEAVFKSPGLELLTRRIASLRRPHILDLGPPREPTIAYFSQYPCVIHIEDLPRTLAEDSGMSAPEEERDVEGAVDRAIVHEDDARFDAILGWDLFDYFDAETIRAVTRRVAPYCRTGTILFIMSSNHESIPSQPGRFTIVDERHLRFERVGEVGRRGPGYSPRGLERIMPDFRLQHSFLLGGGMQDYLFSRA